MSRPPVQPGRIRHAAAWFAALAADNAEGAGVRLRSSEPLSGGLLRKSVLHELPVMEGGVAPVLVLAVAWAGGASVPNGVTAAVITTVICIIVREIVAAWRAWLRGGGHVWLSGILGAVGGLGIVAVKVLFHV